MNNIRSNSYRLLIASSKTAPLSRQEESELFFAYKSASNELQRERIKEKIIMANLRFAESIANKFKNEHIDSEDIRSAAIVGLNTAFAKFKPDTGNKFITFATMEIKGAIMNLINSQESIVHIPANVLRKRRQLNKLVDAGEELCAEDRDALDAASVRFDSLNDKVSKNVDTDNDKMSLVTYGTMLADDLFTADYDTNYSDQSKICKTLLNTLSEREAYIVLSVNGFKNEEKNFRDLEKELGLTHERIRQIYNKAIAKLQAESRSMNLDKTDFMFS